MPRIFDNIKQDLLPALKETLAVSERADFCVGYFNLRGGGKVGDFVEKWSGGDASCCRLLVGMQRLPQEELREALSPSGDARAIDVQRVAQLKKKLAEEFRKQLMIGAPTNADEVTLQRLASQVKAEKVIVKLFLRHPLHAKLYLLYRQDYTNPISGYIGSSNLTLAGLSEQGGMLIYLGESMEDENIPPSNMRRVIETKITKQTHEHMIIFVDKERAKSVWQWVRRQRGKQTASREHTYAKGQPGDSLLQKLAGIAFSIDDLDGEGRVAITEVTGRVAKAFDIEKVTRRFYDEFKAGHSTFSKFLKGLEGQDDLAWYTSVMLDRLMFIYFIQKKGFLDEDMDYLVNKFKESKTRGANQFYRRFLVPLFFEGFAKEGKDRSPEVNQLLGKVPYLNGGLFLPHQLELAYGESINISDTAFERLFDFFDRYSWHLDYRPLRADNEINPDVLGYIFEKYINQKQMGAYYTKEDITDYICKNTIISFLFDKLKVLLSGLYFDLKAVLSTIDQKLQHSKEG